MKYSPTVTLALVLAAGIAGTALAQTMENPGAASNAPQPMPPETQAQATSSQPQPGGMQPQVNSAQPQAGAMQPQANSGQAQPGAVQPPAAYGQAQPMPGQAPPATQQGYNQPRANPNMPMQPAAGQAQDNPEQVRSAQQQLQAAGLYHGPTDGQMDPDTRAAIANFQQQNGLQRTSTLDQQTLDRMTTSRNTGSGSSAQGTPAMAPAGNQQESPAPTGAPMGAGGNTGKSSSR
jgi:hypothetical protein